MTYNIVLISSEIKDLIVEYSVIGITSGVSFMLGALISAIIIIPFEENLIQFLRNRWWLMTSKAVKGSRVKGILYENSIASNIDIKFELLLPYSDMTEEGMSIEKSDDLIREGIRHKYGKEIYREQKMNHITSKSNIIILKSDLDLKPLSNY